MTTDQAEKLARDLYGLHGTAQPLPGYSTCNFYLQTEDAEYVLKLDPVDSDEGALGLEESVMAHLATADLELTTPRLVPTLEGALRGVVPKETGGGRARCLTYLPGTLWFHSKQKTSKLRQCMGAALAQMNLHLESCAHPQARREHSWDPIRAGHQRQFVGAIPDPGRRALAERIFHWFSALVIPRLPELPRSIIHSDANEYNLLVAETTEGARPAGIFDFADVTESATIGELAVAMAYGILEEREPLEAAADYVEGYNQVRPLLPAEIDVLFPLTLSRLAVSVVRSACSRQTEPENAHLFVSEATAWDALERLAEVSPASARDRFAGACGVEIGPFEGASIGELLASRKSHIGSNLSVAYDDPLKIVRGQGQFLFDHRGRPYLDLVNNVCHVGHCHPRVVAAASRQMAILNTNTRYLYDGLTDYADRLCSTLPEPLSVCYFVCSGSEANELALRLARAHTRRKGVMVLEGAYHGHTSSLIEISPYKFLGPGGSAGPEPHVHLAPVPDGYRGRHKGQGPETGRLYGDEVGRVLQEAAAPVGAFICESVLGCGGQILPPCGYLETAYGHVRAAGGVCIADEVQVGFGRMGTHFWAFEPQNVVPDIVVLGKPIGNGHPMAAVVTTPEIAASFANGMEFFSTFGGNPVSCAVGMAVLEVIEEEGLQENARIVGGRMLEGLRELQEKHSLIGEVRGQGLFLGVELVRDRGTLEPAASEAAIVVERMKERGMLLSTDGPLHNVLKIKPPMVLTRDDGDMMVRSLGAVLNELA